jgi:D-psicose/D-tagatose/L-ribulose 3-epimerase
MGINLLLWTGHVTASHREVLEAIAATGFDGVEVPVFDTSDPAHYRELGEMLDGLGLARTVSSAFTDPAHNPVSPDQVARSAALDFTRSVIDCAEALGADLVVGPLFQPLGGFTGAGPTAAELDHCADFLRAITPLLRGAGITCALEPLNRFEAHLLNTAEQAVALMRAVDDPTIGILYDTFHAHIEEKDPLAALSSLIDAGVLAHVHISENDRGVPGSGHAKIREAIALLQSRGYDGWLTIEAFGKAVPELAAATRVWRDFFADPQCVVGEGYRFIGDCLAAARESRT